MGYIPALQICGVVQSRNNILEINKFSIYIFSILFSEPNSRYLLFVTLSLYMSVPTTFELNVIYHNNVNRKNRKQINKILLRHPPPPTPSKNTKLCSIIYTVMWVWPQRATWRRSLPWSIIRK